MALSTNKKRLARILAGSVFYAAGLLYGAEGTTASLALFLSAFVIIGGDVLLRAVRNIYHGRVFDEHFLMSVATVGAFIIGQYPEGVAVMLFYQVGDLFQSFALNKSRKSIADLMDIRPDYANVLRGDKLEKMDPNDVEIGDVICMRPGERVPLDATIIEGNSMVDASALTGESVPREVTVGDPILSGCINVNGYIKAQVAKGFGESTVNKILDMVENASDKKSETENFITKFARYYTPVVVVLAATIAVIPPLLIPSATFYDWIYRALTFLVISCPCALVISVPLSFFGGIGAASRNGVLVKGSNYLEALSQTETVVFDKTGTLTKGVFKVQEVVPTGISGAELLRTAAYAESHSTHPISTSLRQAYGEDIDSSKVTDTNEIPGHGLTTVVDGKRVLAGNAKLMRREGINFPDPIQAIGTVVHVAIDGDYAGYILIADEPKEDSARAISDLKRAGVKETIMLTGDSKSIGEDIAKKLGIDKVYADLLPGDKVEKVEELLAQRSEKGKIAFVGDGINDAPVLARADIGIAMGGLGSDAAIEAADVVIMTDEPSKIATAIMISKRTLRIVKQNIAFALAVKFVVLFLGVMGIATMWEAVFADVGVSVIAIMNAIRALNTEKIGNDDVDIVKLDGLPDAELQKA
jgi:Cd2+/Zn2+-exporting ATPase